jgi:hypothetical protein
MKAPQPLDAGLQFERTTLAWRRTMLTGACVALVCAQAWMKEPSLWVLVTTVMVLFSVCASGLGLIQRRRSCLKHQCAAVTPKMYLLAATSTSIAAAGAAGLLALI